MHVYMYPYVCNGIFGDFGTAGDVQLSDCRAAPSKLNDGPVRDVAVSGNVDLGQPATYG